MLTHYPVVCSNTSHFTFMLIMTLRSLNSLRNSEASLLDVMQEVLKAPGQIRRIDIATAYTDIEALKALFDLIAERGDRRSGVGVRIFLDYQNACKLVDELRIDPSEQSQKLYKVLESSVLKTKNGTNHSIELFAVQLGTLFHSKAFVMETNTHWASCVGSVNFTKRGFITNEEIAITEVLEQSEYQNTESLTKQVLKYLNDELFSLGRAEKIGFMSLAEKRQAPKSAGFRELFLEGRLWYEDKEQTPFSFPLDLPDKVRIRDAEVQGISIPHIDSKLGNGLNVLRLIGLDEKPTDRAPKSRWRRTYCIQTCLGLWAPRIWTPYIDAALAARKEKRKVWLDLVVKKFESSALEIQGVICSAYEETWEQLQKIDDNGLLNCHNLATLEKNAASWVQRMNVRLGTTSFKAKLLSGVSSVEMPDLWGANPSDAKNFEDSFFDQLEYEISRVTSRERSYIASNLQSCLGENPGSTREHLIEVFTEWGSWILGNYEEGIIDDSKEIEAEEDE